MQTKEWVRRLVREMMDTAVWILAGLLVLGTASVWIGVPIAAYVLRWGSDKSVHPHDFGIALMAGLWGLPALCGLGIATKYLWDWSHED